MEASLYNHSLNRERGLDQTTLDIVEKEDRFQKLPGTSQHLPLTLNGWHSSTSMHQGKYKTRSFNYNLMTDKKKGEIKHSQKIKQ